VARSAIEPIAFDLFLVDAVAVAWEGADKGFAAEVADEAVDLAGFAAAMISNGRLGPGLVSALASRDPGFTVRP
jgi:hypothetical protein